MQPCSRAAVQPCSLAAVQPCSRAALQPCSLAAVQPCRRAALQYKHAAWLPQARALQPYSLAVPSNMRYQQFHSPASKETSTDPQLSSVSYKHMPCLHHLLGLRYCKDVAPVRRRATHQVVQPGLAHALVDLSQDHSYKPYKLVRIMLYLRLATMRLLLIQCAHVTLLLHNTESLLSTHYITVLASESNTTNC